MVKRERDRPKRPDISSAFRLEGVSKLIGGADR